MEKTTSDFCPNCEKESPLTWVRKTEDFDVRGEPIAVEVEFARCRACGEEFENSRSAIDPYAAAYRAYRARKGMRQPEEIREFRTQHGLTRKEFSELLGIGIATLSRYENGALQREAHDRAIELAIEPGALARLVADNPGVLDETKTRRILSQQGE
jgi:putative zinc finger/helix-turn-helix YgiT family protein